MNNKVSTCAFVKLFNHLYISPYFQLDAKIQSLYSPWGLDLVVCEGLQPELAARLASCAEFLTTTTTTSTQAPRARTRPPAGKQRTDNVITSRHGVASASCIYITSSHLIIITIIINKLLTYS